MKRFYFLFILILMGTFSNAQIISVPFDQPNIQAGINSASNGDTILVFEGTYLENINFKGKAITVASLFITDGDTSHISKTIIDGSNAANPDSASTVIMYSGEDTTSVLIGFTITGGKGTKYSNKDFLTISGGGVGIINSGGKIMHNTIEENHLSHSSSSLFGGGLYVHVSGNHNAVISNNIIRKNTCTGYSGGGGVGLEGGRIIFENNVVEKNSINSSADFVNGGGMLYVSSLYTEVIEDVHIRNNIVSDNEAICNDNSKAWGGGICVNLTLNQKKVQIYNNLILDNYTNGTGGGTYLFSSLVDFYNNTLWNNDALSNANSIYLCCNSRKMMYNNIVWSEIGSAVNEINISSDSRIYSHYNLIREDFHPGNPVTSYRNYYGLKPIFKPDSYEMAEKSPGIGWGIDSLQISNTLYLAPAFDFHGKVHPNPIDQRVDLGAIESEYKGFVHIPDTAFLYALFDEGVDTDGDSLISYDEAEAAISLDVRGEGIINMTGIEAFINLDFLECGWNELTNLDVSANTALTHLDCDGNQLNSLDVSNNVSLEDLHCASNQLISLDVSRNTALERLICEHNQITSLELCTNYSLGYIGIGGMPSLDTLYVWETPFPPANVGVDTAGSPNVVFLDCATGLTEYKKDEFHIYPNPANDLITIETSQPCQHLIEITSLNGQLLYTDRMEGPTHQIDISSFEKGLYFITVRSRDYVRTEKLIKL